MKDVIALVNLHNSTDLGELTKQRPLASTTFLGRYTFIDFALSNLTNSGIDNIGILVKDHSRSIFKHLGYESTYLKNPKTGFQSLFINEYGLTNPTFNTDINNIKENDWFLYDNDAKYIVIVPVQFVYRIDFNSIIEQHIQSQKLVSVVYRETSHADTRFLGCDKITVDVLGNIQKFTTNDGSRNNANISLETYVISASYLRDLLKRVDSISSLFSLKDLVHYIANYENKVHAIKYDGYCRYFSSLKEYVDFSFELLDTEKFKTSLFIDDWTYHTTSHNSRPIIYGCDAEVSNSVLANGCSIDGKVTHSILARNVIVEEGAEVENSIIFTDTIIKKGIKIKNVVIDKHCKIENKDLINDNCNPIYIPQGAKI